MNFSFPLVLWVSVAIRVILILYSEWHDANSVVKYTDIDYRVFSDATAYLLHPAPGNYAQGWLGNVLHFGNPYTRDTYRYTPLLALIMAPNEWIHPSYGKYLFATCDILNGIIIRRLLPKTPYFAALHLLNPMVFSISTRGSSESILCLLVLLTLHAALSGRWTRAAVLLGLSTHWKIYPGVYGVACLGVIAGPSLVNKQSIAFGLTSVLTFLSLGLACYAIWGNPFLQESYLYHLHRLDHRHNFSPYFYMTYLSYDSSSSTSMLRSPLVSFLPQMVLTIGSGLLFGRKREDLVFAWFVQTAVFVVFNKVCTSQYFLWYLLFVPLLLPSLSMSRPKATVVILVWAGVQALWLSEAYQLEFLGKNVFLGLWVRGLIYIVGNCWVLGSVMESYKTAC